MEEIGAKFNPLFDSIAGLLNVHDQRTGLDRQETRSQTHILVLRFVLAIRRFSCTEYRTVLSNAYFTVRRREPDLYTS